MKTSQDKVRAFMQKAGMHLPDSPAMPTKQTRILMVKLIAEELNELCDAIDCRVFSTPEKPIEVWCNGDRFDAVEAADAIGDLLYVVLNAACFSGINMEPVFNAIHESNMTKFIDGHRREDGKWIKGPSYTPVDLRPIIEQQMAAGGVCTNCKGEHKSLERVNDEQLLCPACLEAAT